MVILNTGGGKSLIFEMTHLLTGKTIVVIEPLIAIINDQTAKMLERKVKVVKLTPETNMDEAMKLAKEGKIGICTLTSHHLHLHFICVISSCLCCLVMMSPEHLGQWKSVLLSMVKANQLGPVVIDEAHCLSSWGRKFRFAYALLQMWKGEEAFRSLALLLLSATVPPYALADMVHILKLPDDHVVFKGELNHPRHFLNFVPFVSVELSLLPRLLSCLAVPDASVLIFLDDKNKVESLYDRLRALAPLLRDQLATFHAGHTAEWRAELGKLFMQGRIRGMIATAAMEMGFDKGNVRLVIMLQKIPSVAAYFQRDGRGGRDNKDQECETLFLFDSVAMAAQRAHTRQVGTFEISRGSGYSDVKELDEKATILLEQRERYEYFPSCFCLFCLCSFVVWNGPLSATSNVRMI